MFSSNNSVPHGAQASSDLWRSILHGRNIHASTSITAYEIRRIINLAEPALQRADREGLSAKKIGFWHFKGWLILMDDPGLSALSDVVAGIKRRLDRLISKGDAAAIDDHVWISALEADCKHETWRRIRFAGSPVFGEGTRYDAMKVHVEISKAHQAWHERVAAGSGAWA